MTIWDPDFSLEQRPRYLALSEALANDVERGRLKPGERLPTHRDLARRLHIAVATVTRAYAEAERRGLVQGETGRGTFVSNSRTGPRLVASDFGGGEAVDLSLDHPLNSEDPDLGLALRELAEQPDLSELLRYQPPAGLEAHRLAGTRWLQWCGLEVPPARVVLCSGAQHAMTVVLSTLVAPGDVLLTESLTYTGIQGVAEHLKLHVQGVAMDGEGLLPEALEEAARSGRARVVFCLPTLQNPTTATQSLERRRDLVEVARRHDLIFVEDDIRRLLLPSAPAPLARLAPERSYYIASISKALTGGLRVAYVVPPTGTEEALRHRVWATQWMVPPLTAEVARMWIENGTARRTFRRKRQAMAVRHEMVRQTLGDFGMRLPAHSSYVWLELPPRWAAADLTHEAYRHGVAVNPARTFAVAPATAPNAIRLCLGAEPRLARLRGALETLRGLLDGSHRFPAAVL